MSNQVILKIPQIGDRIVFEKFLELVGHNTQFNAQLPGQTINAAPRDIYGNVPEAWKTILDFNSALLINVSIPLPGITFTYYRGGPGNTSAVFDEIHIQITPNNPAHNSYENLKYIAEAKRIFKAFDPERTVLSATSEFEAQSAALHESTLTKLEEIAGNITSEMARHQIELADEYIRKQNLLEEQFRQSEVQLQNKYDKQAEELRKKEEDLKLLQSSIDDRDNTHARRATRNKLLEDVQNRIENFGVTVATERKRLPVMAAFIFILFTLSCFALITWGEILDYHKTAGALTSNTGSMVTKALGQSDAKGFQELILTKADLYILWIRFSFIAISLIGIALYFIRWQTRWAEQHSGAEFQLQQFYLDVNRANWVVESGIEWQKDTGFAIPGELLERLTHNLFKAAVESPAAIHPADELASALLGSASKLKLKAGNNEIEFDKPTKIPEKIKPSPPS
jgi:hypothetical protein